MPKTSASKFVILQVIQMTKEDVSSEKPNITELNRMKREGRQWNRIVDISSLRAMRELKRSPIISLAVVADDNDDYDVVATMAGDSTFRLGEFFHWQFVKVHRLPEIAYTTTDTHLFLKYIGASDDR